MPIACKWEDDRPGYPDVKRTVTPRFDGFHLGDTGVSMLAFSGVPKKMLGFIDLEQLDGKSLSTQCPGQSGLTATP